MIINAVLEFNFLSQREISPIADRPANIGQYYDYEFFQLQPGFAIIEKGTLNRTTMLLNVLKIWIVGTEDILKYKM